MLNLAIVLLFLIFSLLILIFLRLGKRDNYCLRLIEKVQTAHQREKQQWANDRAELEAQIKAQEAEIRQVLRDSRYEQLKT